MERRKTNSILEVTKASRNRFHVEIKGVEDASPWKLTRAGSFGWTVELSLNGTIWSVNTMIFFFVSTALESIIDVHNGVSHRK